MYLIFRIRGVMSLRKQENVFNIQDQGEISLRKQENIFNIQNQGGGTYQETRKYILILRIREEGFIRKQENIFNIQDREVEISQETRELQSRAKIRL